MKKLTKMLICCLCVVSLFSLGACSGKGGEKPPKEKTEREKITEYLENTSDASGLALFSEIILANKGIEIRYDDQSVQQAFNEATGDWLDSYIKHDASAIGKIERESLEENAAYKMEVELENEGVFFSNNLYYEGDYYDDGEYVYLMDYQMKEVSVGWANSSYLKRFESFIQSAKEMFAMNDSLSDSALAQIGTRYSMETVGENTVIKYKASSGEQTAAGVELTSSCISESVWTFDKEYRFIEYSLTTKSVYKTEYAEQAGRNEGSSTFTVKAWNGTITPPTNVENYQ